MRRRQDRILALVARHGRGRVDERRSAEEASSTERRDELAQRATRTRARARAVTAVKARRRPGDR